MKCKMSKKMSLLLSMAMLMTTISGVNVSADFSTRECKANDDGPS